MFNLEQIIIPQESDIERLTKVAKDGVRYLDN